MATKTTQTKTSRRIGFRIFIFSTCLLCVSSTFCADGGRTCNMTRRKAFWLRIEIDVHSVSSGGVNLCRSGNVAFRVHTLSSVAVTMPARPSFPIHFHEKLIFEKVIDCVGTLAELQDHLNNEPLKLELIQWPRRYLVQARIVSHFRTKLSRLLFPGLVTNDLSHGGDVRIEMEPSENFGGTSGAHVELSTKLIVAETTSHRTIRIPEVEIICSNNHIQPSNCCRHNAKSQLATCGCPSTDHCRRKPRSKQKKHNQTWTQIHETTSCNNCCICNCYSGYFDCKSYPGYRSRSCSCVKTCNDFQEPKTRKNSGPTLSSSVSSLGSYAQNSRFTGDEVENPMSRRQLFYENLDLFYRKLRDTKNNPNHF